MRGTEKVKEILKNFPDDKRKEYVGHMKKQIVHSWFINNCENCAHEFTNTLNNWEKGEFEKD
ncbi:MAG: hypothetical protein MRERC_2c008 [Mycoplasmataceae bacterium RC_NB112A]|nr:MAG: hypothetical protein MRERC_6c093 [Mycoplasmataceae bacterium RC_NB112A]KLL02136.1 MAG: hypothetical protein MRERC_4c096 [Mycoplasmataceae bacterium RC_NB112A]KLL02172.1 MAG: hypothetical protein MRERC_4c146 [Mycoplasmataceae bacterium RC_NB112A]KLL02298.1 MAG: hypothetical protein MRERC_2c008 [Mycoplasmataceae bacterium RC_NB112A]